ncbi:hypothetical protein A2U01_0039883, partial [Trifolium medium]|nr:hypothetical protein [Trifolium medium]
DVKTVSKDVQLVTSNASMDGGSSGRD